MASSRKRPSAEAKGVAVALSGGIDSVVLLHQLRHVPGIRAVHVHHGLSPNADAWTAFDPSEFQQKTGAWTHTIGGRRIAPARRERGSIKNFLRIVVAPL